MKRTFSFYMQTYLNSGGQPQNNLGCPGLSAMYQWITLNKDNRTTYFATSILYKVRALFKFFIFFLLPVNVPIYTR